MVVPTARIYQAVKMENFREKKPKAVTIECSSARNETKFYESIFSSEMKDIKRGEHLCFQFQVKKASN